MKVDNVYEALADEIKSHHVKFGEYLLIGSEMLVGALVIFCVLAMEQGESKDIIYGIAVFVGFACGMLCSWLHCQQYVILNDDENAITIMIGKQQRLEDFSIKIYYNIIGKRLQKKALLYAIIFFGVILIVNLLHFIENPSYVSCIAVTSFFAMLIAMLIVYLLCNWYYIHCFTGRIGYGTGTNRSICESDKRKK